MNVKNNTGSFNVYSVIQQDPSMDGKPREATTMSYLDFIKSRVQQHKRAIEIYKELVETYGTRNSPSRTSVYFWATRLRSASKRDRIAASLDLPKSALLGRSREYTKTRTAAGIRVTDIHRELEEMFGSKAPSYAAVKIWSKKYLTEANANNTNCNIQNINNSSMSSSSHTIHEDEASSSSACLVAPTMTTQNTILESNSNTDVEIIDDKDGEDCLTLSGIMRQRETNNNINNKNNRTECYETFVRPQEPSAISNSRTSQQPYVKNELIIHPTETTTTRTSSATTRTLAQPVVNGGSHNNCKHIQIPTANGFDRGLEPEKICEILNVGGERMFVIKWKNSTRRDLGN